MGVVQGAVHATSRSITVKYRISFVMGEKGMECHISRSGTRLEPPEDATRDLPCIRPFSGQAIVRHGERDLDVCPEESPATKRSRVDGNETVIDLSLIEVSQEVIRMCGDSNKCGLERVYFPA